LKQRWEAMDSLYERIFKMFEENFDMPAAVVETMRLEDIFEKRLIKTYAKVESI
jgi:hypothetical protein